MQSCVDKQTTVDISKTIFQTKRSIFQNAFSGTVHKTLELVHNQNPNSGTHGEASFPTRAIFAHGPHVHSMTPQLIKGNEQKWEHPVQAERTMDGCLATSRRPLLCMHVCTNDGSAVPGHPSMNPVIRSTELRRWLRSRRARPVPVRSENA